jgi:hypothetical protein
MIYVVPHSQPSWFTTPRTGVIINQLVAGARHVVGTAQIWDAIEH